LIHRLKIVHTPKKWPSIWEQKNAVRVMSVACTTRKENQASKPSVRERALQYLDGLYGYAMTLVRNQAQAEDLVQETYLRAMTAFHRLRPDSNLKSWLFTILRNIRLNQIRDGLAMPLVVEIDEPSDNARQFEDKSSKDPLFLYLKKVKQSDVRKAIEDLPAAYREVIVLREFEDLSYEEIAAVLNCPPGTVMSRLSRAREKLKEMLQHWSVVPDAAANEARLNDSM